MRLHCLLILATTLCLAANQAGAQRTIWAPEYAARLKGMWAGQLLGNCAGRPVEGGATSYDGYAITEYPIKWDDLAGAVWRGTDGTVRAAGYWDGDDDTCFELLYGNLLGANPSPTNGELTALWQTDVTLDQIYIANRQAKYLISSHGKAAPDSGSARCNMHGPWSIDSQITTESLGALAPGMRGQAATLAGQFGGVTNCGLAVHAARFYAAMYAQAAFSADVSELLGNGLEAVPLSSRTRQIVQAAMDAYQQDVEADGQADNWLAARDSVISLVSQRGRHRSWVESGMNTGMTVLALLYGQGNARSTIEYAVRGGYDSDCNPATAAGLIGLMKGYDALLADLGLSTPPDAYLYRPNYATSLHGGSYTLDQAAMVLQSAAEQQILNAYGPGAIVGEGADRRYCLGEAGTGPDAIGPLEERYPPAGPAGLVGQVLASGGTVQVATSAANHDPTLDRRDYRTLIDGVTEACWSGVLPYDTYTGSGSPRTDWYQLAFPQAQVFGKVVFYEGDIRWNGINADPYVSTPYGGYFTTLTVQVLRDGQWEDVENLAPSEALDPLAFYQRIEMTFAPVSGMAVRVIGQAGGTRPYTSCLELEAFAPWPGDADNDGMVDVGDLGILAGHWGCLSGATWRDGDFNADGAINVGDLGVLAGWWGWSAAPPPTAVPEPSAGLLLLGMMAMPKVWEWIWRHR